MQRVNPPQTWKILLAFLGLLACVGLAGTFLIGGILTGNTGIGALGVLVSLALAFGCGFYAEHCASLDY